MWKGRVLTISLPRTILKFDLQGQLRLNKAKVGHEDSQNKICLFVMSLTCDKAFLLKFYESVFYPVNILHIILRSLLAPLSMSVPCWCRSHFWNCWMYIVVHNSFQPLSLVSNTLKRKEDLKSLSRYNLDTPSPLFLTR